MLDACSAAAMQSLPAVALLLSSFLISIARLRVPAVSDDYRELAKTPYGILGKWVFLTPSASDGSCNTDAQAAAHATHSPNL